MVAEAVNPRELTSTLHLGLRSASGEFPTDALDQLIASFPDEERAVLEEVLHSNGERAMLIIHRGPNKGERFLLTEEPSPIGRATSSAIFFDDATVSRKHAVIYRGFPGDFTIEDTGSLNGTYVNNEMVSIAKLTSGDEIQIGKYHLLFIGASAEKGER